MLRESTLRRASESNSLDEARDEMLTSSSPLKTEFTSLSAPAMEINLKIVDFTKLFSLFAATAYLRHQSVHFH